jgi:hypothetical protein
LLSNDAGRGRLSPFLVLLGGLNNVTESIYVEECSIDGLDDSCEVNEDDEYLSATMSDEWSSSDDVDANGEKSSMEQQPIGEPPDISGGLKY